MRLFISTIILVLLILIALVFGSQNTQTIELNYLIAKSELTVAAAVSIFTSLGFLIGLVFALTFSLFRALKRKRKVKQPSSSVN